MKLSEAMRKGATFAPQIIGGGRGYATGNSKNIEATCAFGAAAHGILGVTATRDEIAQLAGNLHREYELEACLRLREAGLVNGFVVSIRSDAGMPREAIADLLDEVGL